VDEVASAICTITRDSSQAKRLVDEVNLGSREQSQGIEQISPAILQMQNLTQKTAGTAEEAAAAAVKLNGQSGSPREVTGRLSAMIGVAGN
jgi:methyl-accepting chemotaxis protein